MNTKLIYYSFLALALSVGCTVGVKMEMTLYANANYTGQSITVTQSHLDFGCVDSIIGLGNGINSLCYVGAWALKRSSSSVSFSPSLTRSCRVQDGSTTLVGVLRSGPADTITPALAFDRSKQIIVVEKTAESNLNITSNVISSTSIYTYGFTSWTLYELNNFEGASICITSSTEISWREGRDLGIASIGSAMRGCSGKQDVIGIEDKE